MSSNGILTRRRLLEWSVAGSGVILAPAPWRAAFGEAKPYKIGTVQCTFGRDAAAIGKTALVGGSDGGRPDQQSGWHQWPAGRTHRRGRQVETRCRTAQGGEADRSTITSISMSAVSSRTFAWRACRFGRSTGVVNIISVCLDTTITTSKCSRYTFGPFDYAPAQAVAFAPYMVNKLGKRWHIAYADYAWGQSTRDAYAEQIKKAGGSSSAPPVFRSARPT